MQCESRHCEANHKSAEGQSEGAGMTTAPAGRYRLFRKREKVGRREERKEGGREGRREEGGKEGEREGERNLSQSS